MSSRVGIAFALAVLSLASFVSAAQLTYIAPTNRVVNHYTLRLDGANLVLIDDDSGGLLRCEPLAQTSGVVIRGADGDIDDTLTVDLGGGVFVLPRGIRYDGGAAGYDTLVTRNGWVPRTVHRMSGRGAGVLTLGELTISYGNLEPVTDLTPAALLIINGTDAADNISITDGGMIGDGVVRISIGLSEPIDFANKTAVIINGGVTAGDSGDNFTIDFTDLPTGLTTLTLNGDDAGSTAFGNDHVDFQAAPAGPTININGGGGNDSITIFNNAVVSGTVDLGAGSDSVVFATTAGVRVNLGLNVASLVANMDSTQAQANASIPSTATGTATVTNYDLTTHTFDIMVSVSGIAVPDVIGLRIFVSQRPGLPDVEIINLLSLGPPIAVAGGFIFSKTGVVLPELAEAKFLGGSTNIAVATPANPARDIRGQFVSSGNVSSPTGASSVTGPLLNIENVVGSSRNDSIAGSFAANSLAGSGGDDVILGGPGNDSLIGDAGDDFFMWSDGDGSDVADGSSGVDTFLVTGSLIAGDAFTVANTNGAVDLQRTNLIPFSISIATTEFLTVNGAGGADIITLLDLTGTAIAFVTLIGGDGGDTFNVTPGSAIVAVYGNLPNSRTGDTLTISTAGTTNPTLHVFQGTSIGSQGQFNFGNRETVTFETVETFNPADVQIAKSTMGSVVEGGTLPYTVTISNPTSIDAIHVAMSDFTPENTAFVSATIPAGVTCFLPAVGGTGMVTCIAPVLPRGASVSFTFVFRVNPSTPAGTLITNSVTSTNPGDPDITNNTASTATVVTASASADLSVTKSSSGSALAGGTVTYTITVANSGPSVAQSVMLSDALPIGTSFASEAQNSGPSFTCIGPPVGTNGTVSCTIATLAASVTTRFTIVANVNTSIAVGTPIVNIAAVNSTTPDPNAANNVSSTSLISSASIAVLDPRLLVALAIALASMGALMTHPSTNR